MITWLVGWLVCWPLPVTFLYFDLVGHFKFEPDVSMLPLSIVASSIRVSEVLAGRIYQDNIINFYYIFSLTYTYLQLAVFSHFLHNFMKENSVTSVMTSVIRPHYDYDVWPQVILIVIDRVYKKDIDRLVTRAFVIQRRKESHSQRIYNK